MARLPKGMVRFVGISYYELDVWTHRPRHQIINIGLYGEMKDSVEEVARNEIATLPVPGEIYRQTLQKNLFIVSESAVKRSYKRAWQSFTEDAVYEPECDHPQCHNISVTAIAGLNYCADHEPE